MIFEGDKSRGFSKKFYLATLLTFFCDVFRLYINYFISVLFLNSFSKPVHRHTAFQICLGSKEEAEDNAITNMVHNQICTSLFKYLQEMSVVSARKLKFLITPTRMNCLLKDQSLFQSAATLTSSYCLIINLTIRPSGKCPIKNI